MGALEQNPALVLGELGLISSLGDMGIPLIVGSEIEDNPVFSSRYADRKVVFSAYDTKEFIDELCELGKSLSLKAVLFSDDDRAILNISNNRDRLKDYYHFLYPSLDRVSGILDKQRFVELSSKYELPAPASYTVTNVDDFEIAAPNLEYPCIVKPSQRHFWWGKEFVDAVGFYKKAIKCLSYAQLKDLYLKIAKVNPSVVLQEYVEGADRQHYSANLFVNADGELQGYYIAQKLRIYPIKAGTGTYVVTLKNPDVLDISLDIIKKLELKGLVNIQFKRDSRTGKYKLMEIHARNSLWSLLGKKAGANLAYLYYRYLVAGEERKSVAEAKSNVKYINLMQDFRAFRGYRAEGSLTFWKWLQSLRGDRVFAVFSLKDPMPTLLLLQRYFTSRIKPAKKSVEKQDEKEKMGKIFNTEPEIKSHEQ